MTTAHRPTFDPARGREAQRGPAYHQRLLPAHTYLKHRKAGQGGIGGVAAPDSTDTSGNNARGDLRAELLKAEAALKAKKAGDISAEDDTVDAAIASKRKFDDSGNDIDEPSSHASEEDPEAKRRRLILEEAHDIDADSDEEDAESDSDSSDEDEDEEDEEEELMRELAKIKAERAAAKAAEEEAKAKEEMEQREFDIAKGNPLLNKPEFGTKRRWDDDVVFRNQARGTEDRGKRKEFVNDLLRSDFHKKFMSRYVR